MGDISSIGQRSGHKVKTTPAGPTIDAGPVIVVPVTVAGPECPGL